MGKQFLFVQTGVLKLKGVLYSVSQRRVDKLVWMAQVLAHQGSWQTAQSYNTVVVEFAYTNETVRTPDAHMLRLVLEEVKSLRAECHGMRDEINELTVALAEVSEDEPKERNAPHKKREMKTAATSQEDLDDRIRDALWELKEKGVPENKRRYPDGTNRSRCLEYEKRKRAAMQSLLPNDYVQRKNRAANIERTLNRKRCTRRESTYVRLENLIRCETTQNSKSFCKLKKRKQQQPEG
jgi:hypothetical protein